MVVPDSTDGVTGRWESGPVHTDTRQLVIVRHAQAEELASSDRERELTQRGRADAEEAGRWLRARGVVPDHAMVSTAARAQGTWNVLKRTAGWELEASLDDAWYAAEPETAMDLVREAPEDAQTVVVVGHNPTVATLAHTLDDGDGDAESTGEMLRGFPACAVALFDVDGPWADLDLGSGRLLAFHVGRA